MRSCIDYLSRECHGNPKIDNEHSLMCPVESDETERVDRESANRESMGTDRCTITSGRWYRIHAERGSRDTE
jgi:hypothetical protein